jgi:hypothetical protein
MLKWEKNKYGITYAEHEGVTIQSGPYLGFNYGAAATFETESGLLVAVHIGNFGSRNAAREATWPLAQRMAAWKREMDGEATTPNPDPAS